MKRENIRYYAAYTDDFVESANQEYALPDDYRWVRNKPLERFYSITLYWLAALISSVYLRLTLGVRYKNRRALNSLRKTGGFLYCNHTQPVGDVFLPVHPCLPGRVYTVASPANLGIPVMGKVLPYLGALPLPDTVNGMKRFLSAMEYRLEQHCCIAVFPEAHVWPWYTGIRPFPDSAFKFPVKYQKPVWCMTVTYQKRKWRKKPKATVYIDGPFFPDQNLHSREQSRELCECVHHCMRERSLNSNCEYIHYEPQQTPER